MRSFDPLLVLQSGIDHLGAGNFRARILDVFGEGRLVPGDAGILVGVGVVVALDGAGLASEQSVQQRADAVLRGLADLMAGRQRA